MPPTYVVYHSARETQQSLRLFGPCSTTVRRRVSQPASQLIILICVSLGTYPFFLIGVMPKTIPLRTALRVESPLQQTYTLAVFSSWRCYEHCKWATIYQARANERKPTSSSCACFSGALLMLLILSVFLAKRGYVGPTRDQLINYGEVASALYRDRDRVSIAN